MIQKGILEREKLILNELKLKIKENNAKVIDNNLSFKYLRIDNNEKEKYA